MSTDIPTGAPFSFADALTYFLKFDQDFGGKSFSVLNTVGLQHDLSIHPHAGPPESRLDGSGRPSMPSPTSPAAIATGAIPR